MLIKDVQQTHAYRAVRTHYGERMAQRSGVPLIQHIDDGLVVLQAIGACDDAAEAFCLHPLFQSDEAIGTALEELDLWAFSPKALVLVMEHRRQANAWLPDKVWNNGPLVSQLRQSGNPAPGPLFEVRHMLIADKVQNCKDFIAHQMGTHPRSAELHHYYLQWLQALHVDQAMFENLCNAIDAARDEPDPLAR
jgi:hypothetical protein